MKSRKTTEVRHSSCIFSFDLIPIIKALFQRLIRIWQVSFLLPLIIDEIDRSLQIITGLIGKLRFKSTISLPAFLQDLDTIVFIFTQSLVLCHHCRQ